MFYTSFNYITNINKNILYVNLLTYISLQYATKHG